MSVPLPPPPPTTHHRQEQEDAEGNLTYKDYSNLRVGRFGPRYPKEKLMLARPPSNILYITGLEAGTTSETIENLFRGDHCVAVDMFRHKTGEGRMEFDSVEEAYACLIKWHGTKEIPGIGLPLTLRLAFSDKGITDRPVMVCLL